MRACFQFGFEAKNQGLKRSEEAAEKGVEAMPCASVELAIPYAKERIAFEQPIAQKQAIAFMLAEMQIEVNSMRHLVWKAASQLENGLDATRATTLAQTYVNREVMKIADNGLQVFGGHGFIREYPVEMWYRNARALTVNEAVCAL